jgi:hypothetical protein
LCFCSSLAPEIALNSWDERWDLHSWDEVPARGGNFGNCRA